MESYNDNGTKAGTVSGTLLTIFYNIHSADIVKTIILAAIGASVSCGVSLLLKMIMRKIRKG